MALTRKRWCWFTWTTIYRCIWTRTNKEKNW